MNNIAKTLSPYLLTFAILAAWYSLVMLKMTPAQPYVELLGTALGAGGSHIIHMAKDARAAKQTSSEQ